VPDSLPKTLVFTHGGGRFANQLYNYAHLLAFTCEYPGEFEFIHMAFWQYAELLAISDQDPLCTDGQFCTSQQHPIFRWLARQLTRLGIGNDTTFKRFLIWFLYLWYGHPLSRHSQTIAIEGDWLIARNIPDFNLCLVATQADLRSAQTTCFSGFNFCEWQLVLKHWPIIRERLQIHPRYQERGQAFIQPLRHQYSLLIGVMVRQGDYRTWAAGRYFFETSQYADWMTQALRLFPEYAPTEICFVLASDEPQQMSSFPDLSVYFTTGIAGQGGHYIESFVELSLCDYLLTPPSTFSMWAALLGDVPILSLLSAGQQLARSDFAPPYQFELLKATAI
jgi:Glycosyl transferase family 11